MREELNRLEKEIRADVDNALAFMRLTDFESAQEQLKQLVRIHPGRAYVHFGLGIFYLEQKDPEQGVEELERALDIDQELVNARLALIKYYQHHNLDEKAHEHLLYLQGHQDICNKLEKLEMTDLAKLDLIFQQK